MIFDYFLLGGVLFGLALTFAYCGITGISPVPSSRTSRKAILASLPENPSGTVYELGAGWGTLAFPLARRYPGKEVVAYELSPLPWLFMKLRWHLTGPRNLNIRRRNFLRANLASAGLIICYLHPQALEKLVPKLEKELASEALIISNTFHFPGWVPSFVQQLEDTMCPELLFYQVGPALSKIAIDASQNLPFC